MTRSLVLLVLISCARPAVAPPVAVASPLELRCEKAKAFAAKAGRVLGECACWTSDSVLCTPSPTTLMWCEAKADARPRCELALDWTPQPQPQVPAQPAKPEAKKK